MGTTLHSQNNKMLFQAPMAEICHQWQFHKNIGLDWYFDTVKNLSGESVVFHRVKPQSQFYFDLVEKVTGEGLRPEFTVTPQDFCSSAVDNNWMKFGVKWTFIIFEPLPADFLIWLNQNKKWMPQFKFVVVARKDWDFKSAYRSLPYFVRPSLYIDFPVSFAGADPFFEKEEISEVMESLNREFDSIPLQSYCPNIGWGTFEYSSNILEIKKVAGQNLLPPALSVLVDDWDLVLELENLDWASYKGAPVELLFACDDENLNQNVPKFENVSFSLFSVQLADPLKSFNRNSVNNFLAGRSRGENLWILDKRQWNQFEISMMDSFRKLPQSPHIFCREHFVKVGGFDESLIEEAPNFFDFKIRLDKLLDESEQKNVEFSDDPQALDFESTLQWKLANHKFLESKKVAPVEKKATRKWSQGFARRWKNFKSIYLHLMTQTPKVIFEAHLKFFRWTLGRNAERVEDFFKAHAWRLNPKSYKLFWKLKPNLDFRSYKLYWKLKSAFDLKSYKFYWRLGAVLDLKSYKLYWKLKALLDLKSYEAYWKLRSFFDLNSYQSYWKLKSTLNMRSYKFYWRLKALTNWEAYNFYWKLKYLPRKVLNSMKAHLWRLNPQHYKWYWNLRYAPHILLFLWLKLSFPLRKIYYFSKYQWQTRISGRPSEMRTKS